MKFTKNQVHKIVFQLKYRNTLLKWNFCSTCVEKINNGNVMNEDPRQATRYYPILLTFWKNQNFFLEFYQTFEKFSTINIYRLFWKKFKLV